MKGFVDCTDLSLAESAIALAQNGLKVFPVIEGKKNPATESGHLNATDNLSVINELWKKYPHNNIGVRTGNINGFFVVDVDVKNGKNGELTLSELEEKHGKLPTTLEAITPSGGRHLFFNCNGIEIKSRVDILEGLDARGEGGYVLVEPSVYKGNSYKFIDVNVDIADAPEWLVNVLNEKRNNDNSGKISEGGRNDFIFKQALQLKIVDKFTEMEDVIESLLASYKARCEGPYDEKEIKKTIESAFKYEIKPLVPEIEELNKKHAVIDVGGKTRVLKNVINELGHRDFQLSTPEDFKALYANRYVVVEGKTKTLGSYWFSHPQRRQYEGIGFYPKGAPEGYYNLWNGFAVDPKEGDCSLFLEFVKDIIASGDQAIYDYIIAWCAHMIQHPDQLVGTALVLRGLQGVGKGTFANALGFLLGQHYMIANNSGHLVGRFNGHLKGKVLLLADEAFWGGDKNSEGTLKSMVTEPYITIEEKGVNAYTIKNRLHMIFATNNDWAVPAGAQERRFFVIDVSDKRMQDRPYFKKIAEQMNNGGYEALLHYLLNYDLSAVSLDTFPKTSALFETKLMSMSPVQKFIFNILSTGNIIGKSTGWNEGLVAKEHLYGEYLIFAKSMNIKHPVSQQEFGIMMLKMFPKGLIATDVKMSIDVLDKKIRMNAYKFPSLEDCRKQFEKNFQHELQWDSE